MYYLFLYLPVVQQVSLSAQAAERYALFSQAKPFKHSLNTQTCHWDTTPHSFLIIRHHHHFIVFQDDGKLALFSAHPFFFQNRNKRRYINRWCYRGGNSLIWCIRKDESDREFWHPRKRIRLLDNVIIPAWKWEQKHAAHCFRLQTRLHTALLWNLGRVTNFRTKVNK